MKIEIISKEKAEEIKKSFNERFLLSWKEYKAENNEWIKLITGKKHSISSNMIHKYERMAISKEMTFESVLNILKKKEGDIYFMSENEEFPECKGVISDGVEYKGGVFKANAGELADLIEKEWNIFLEDENAEISLPLDLYVFDEKMKKALAFSEDMVSYIVDKDEGEIEIETRLCFSCKSVAVKGKYNF